MPATYDNLATTTVASPTSSVQFLSIPQTYTDLVVIISGTTDGTSTHNINFNGVTTNTYGNVRLFGNYSGPTVSGASVDNRTAIAFASAQVGVSATVPYFAQVNIFSYRATNVFKQIYSEISNTLNGNSERGHYVQTWRSTAAITSMTFSVPTFQFQVGTTFTLYGILRA